MENIHAYPLPVKRLSKIHANCSLKSQLFVKLTRTLLYNPSSKSTSVISPTARVSTNTGTGRRSCDTRRASSKAGSVTSRTLFRLSQTANKDLTSSAVLPVKYSSTTTLSTTTMTTGHFLFPSGAAIQSSP
jgi:hypothetical protein